MQAPYSGSFHPPLTTVTGYQRHNALQLSLGDTRHCHVRFRGVASSGPLAARIPTVMLETRGQRQFSAVDRGDQRTNWHLALIHACELRDSTFRLRLWPTATLASTSDEVGGVREIIQYHKHNINYLLI